LKDGAGCMLIDFLLMLTILVHHLSFHSRPKHLPRACSAVQNCAEVIIGCGVRFRGEKTVCIYTVAEEACDYQIFKVCGVLNISLFSILRNPT